MAVDKKVPNIQPGVAGFESETWGNLQNWQYGDTPALTTQVVSFTASGADLEISFLDVLATNGEAADQAGSTAPEKANYISAMDITIPDGETASVSVYVAGHFEMEALGWDSSYDTDAKKAAAFQGSVSPTIFVSKSAYDSDAIY